MRPDPSRYRPCVGAVIVNDDGRVWLGKRFGVDGPHCWQFPQGGTDGEPAEDALWRELHEEIGLRRSDVDVLDRTERELFYDFPDDVLSQGRFKTVGQRQHWFALRPVRAIDFVFDREDPPEFSDWRWASMHEAVERIIPFKRSVYEAVAGRFAHLWSG